MICWAGKSNVYPLFGDLEMPPEIFQPEESEALLRPQSPDAMLAEFERRLDDMVKAMDSLMEQWKR